MTTLHLVRGSAADGGPPLEVVADRDWIVYLLPGLRFMPLGPDGPIAAGPIDHDQLVSLCFAADRVITW